MLKNQLFLFIAHYSYFGIFVAVVLGILGVPVPDEFLMTFSGYLIGKAL